MLNYNYVDYLLSHTTSNDVSKCYSHDYLFLLQNSQYKLGLIITIILTKFLEFNPRKLNSNFQKGDK